jgi:hypothetical protein
MFVASVLLLNLFDARGLSFGSSWANGSSPPLFYGTLICHSSSATLILVLFLIANPGWEDQKQEQGQQRRTGVSAPHERYPF